LYVTSRTNDLHCLKPQGIGKSAAVDSYQKVTGGTTAVTKPLPEQALETASTKGFLP